MDEYKIVITPDAETDLDELVYDILINCTFFKSYDIIQTRQSEGPLYEIHA